MKPFFSIIIPAYNRKELLLARALPSVFNQTDQDFEVIVVDDGSTDGMQAALAPLVAQKKVNYISQQNKGVSAARNAGMKAAQGEIICFLDSDDELLKNYLERLRLAFSDQQVDVAIPSFVLADERGRRSIALASQKPGWMQGIGGGIALRRSNIAAKGLWYDESLRNFEDTDLGLRVAASCKTAVLDEPLYVYHFIFNIYKNAEKNLSSNPRYLLDSFEVFKKKNTVRYAQFGPQALSFLNYWEGTLYGNSDIKRAHRAFAAALRLHKDLRTWVYYVVTFVPSVIFFRMVNKTLIFIRRIYKSAKYSL